MNLNYDKIILECDKRIDQLKNIYLDDFYLSFGADKSNIRSMITQFFIQDLKFDIFKRLKSILPPCIFLEADYLPDKLVIPENISTLNPYALADNSSVKNLVINCDAEKIPRNFSSGATALETVTINGNIQSIEDDAFSNCPNLKKIILPDGIKKISINAFNNDNNITSLQFDEDSIENLNQILDGLVWVEDEDGDPALDEKDNKSAFFNKIIRIKKK